MNGFINLFSLPAFELKAVRLVSRIMGVSPQKTGLLI